MPVTYYAPGGNIPFLRGTEDDLSGRYREEFIPERNTTAYVSGLNWRLRERDFLAYFLLSAATSLNGAIVDVLQSASGTTCTLTVTLKVACTCDS